MHAVFRVDDYVVQQLRKVESPKRRGIRIATVTITLKDEFGDQVAAAAEDQGIAVSDYIRSALEMHMSMGQAGDIGADRNADSEGVALTPYQRKVLQLLHRNMGHATVKGSEKPSRVTDCGATT